MSRSRDRKGTTENLWADFQEAEVSSNEDRERKKMLPSGGLSQLKWMRKSSGPPSPPGDLWIPRYLRVTPTPGRKV
jgi:hypothetical protein